MPRQSITLHTPKISRVAIRLAVSLTVFSLMAGAAAQNPRALSSNQENQTTTTSISRSKTKAHTNNPRPGARDKTPVTQRKHDLRYRFALPPAVIFDPEHDHNLPYSLYQFSLHSVETIRRDAQESVLALDFSSEILLTATPAVNSNATGAGPTDQNFFALNLNLYRFTATEMKAGHGSRVWHFDPAKGMTRTYRDGRIINTPLDDRYVERESLRSAAAHPIVLPLRNGALVAKPTESAFLKQIRLSWVGQAVINILPPLPALKLTVGRKWQAGIPLQFVGPSEPTVARCKVEFRSYDPSTGMAEIGWEYTAAEVHLTPTSGIHHIDAYSVATVKASGVLFLHAQTGWVRSADTIIRATITNTATPGLVVDSIRTMHLHCHDTPAAILNWTENQADKALAMTNAEK